MISDVDENAGLVLLMALPERSHPPGRGELAVGS